MLGFKRRSNAVVTLILAAIVALYATAKFAGQDFAVYYAAASSLFAGRTDLYSADFALGPVMDYRYPPIFILIIAPIALLPAPASKIRVRLHHGRRCALHGTIFSAGVRGSISGYRAKESYMDRVRVAIH
jgi:hypothetical protein